MIRLTIIKAPESGTCLGTDMVFGPGGGTIGRSRSSTWPLIDTDFLISRVHAEIHVDNGQYFVTDKSTNGLFLNQARKPLGQGQATALRNGDHVHLGHYTLAITLESPQQSAMAADLGGIGFLDNIAADNEEAAVEAESIPDDWLHENPGILSTDTGTLITNRGNDVLSASWFENSLRMMLIPVIGNGINSMPSSDLIALVTQLARKAVGTQATQNLDEQG
jgi:type VI secretion system FHA domain protein